MAIIPIGLVFRAASAEARERAELNASIVTMLNTPGVLELTGDEAVEISHASKEWVKTQLGSPESASFVEEHVRRHASGVIVVAGRVESNNLFGGRCSNWYIAAIDLNKGMARGDLVDFDPVREKVPLPLRVESVDALSYATPASELAPRRNLFWPIFWVAVAACFIGSFLIGFFI